jgi:hypothetical protein
VGVVEQAVPLPKPLSHIRERGVLFISGRRAYFFLDAVGGS